MSFGEIVENTLRGVGANNLTDWFIAILLCVFVLALGMLILGKWRTFTSYTPSLLTSIGILGTFAGIITGLLEFNPQNLDESIGPLLEGLKTAFISSLVGMTLSILFKFTTAIIEGKKNSGNSDGYSIRHLYAATERQTEIVAAQAKDVSDHTLSANRLLNAVASENEFSIFSRLAAMQEENANFHKELLVSLHDQNEITRNLLKTISDDGESSLTGQMKLLRTDLTDGQKQIGSTLQQQLASTSVMQKLMDQLVGLGNENGNVLEALTTVNKQVLLESEKVASAALKQFEVLESLEGGSQIYFSQTKQHQEMQDGHWKTLLPMIGGDGRDGEASLIESCDSLADTAARMEQKSSRHYADMSAYTDEVTKAMESRAERFEQFGKGVDARFDETNRLLATSPTEQVIAALKEVTKEFNSIIIDQFGDNFKQLNLAVGQLLNWQENYRVQLAEMDRQYNASVTAIQRSEESVSRISKSSEAIPQQMHSLGEIMKANQAQVEDINRHLQAFAQIRDNAVKALPEIEGTIGKLISGLTTGSEKLIGSVEESSKLMSQAIGSSAGEFTTAANEANSQLIETGEALKRTADGMATKGDKVVSDFGQFGDVLIRQATKARDEVEKGLRTSHETLLEEIKKSAIAHAEKASEIHRGLGKTIEQTMEETGIMIKGSIETEHKGIADARNHEVQRVMEQLGKSLATITDTFTTDYRKLVDAMAKVVNYRSDR